MAVEIWNDDTANLIDAFDDEVDALRAVRAVILRDGEDAVRAWALDRYDGRPMVRGAELIKLALGPLAA